MLVFVQSGLLLVGLATKPSEPQLSVCCNPNRGGFGVIDACQK